MEDEHIRIDDLSAHLVSLFKLPKPSAFYGVIDFTTCDGVVILLVSMAD